MTWSFETEPEFQEKLDWADAFVREEVEPLDLLWPDLVFTPPDERLKAVLDPLKDQVRAQGLWATHLGPELGGEGYGQLKLSLLNEILGRSSWAPVIFGCQAPDTGNAEIIAHYGTAEQKEQYLKPLLQGELFSCYSMTEPHAGADPTLFKTRATKDGDEWVIEGWKFFSSNAKTAAFLIVMAVTDPDVSAYQGMSMFLVPTDTPGREHRPRRRARRRAARRGVARADPLRRRPRPRRRAARRRGPGVRHRPDPPRRRAHPPRHAHDRHGHQGARRHVRAGAEPRGVRRAARREAVRAGLHRRLLRPARAVPALRALHRVDDRQAQRLPQGAQGHLGREGDHAHACSTTSRGAPCRCTAPSA